MGHRGQAADRVGTGAIDITEDKGPNGAQLPHADTDIGSDQRIRHPLSNVIAKFVEAETDDADRTKFGNVQNAVAADLKAVIGVVLAIELNVDRIPRPQHVIRRHGNVGRRRKRCGYTVKQLLAERLMR